MRRIDLILPFSAGAARQDRRRRRIGGRDEADFAGCCGRRSREDQASVLAIGRHADARSRAPRLLVERDVLFDRLAEPVQPRAVGAPMLVDLGEDDRRRCRRSRPGSPMPTSVTVSMSSPVARSRIRSLNRSEPSSSTGSRQPPVGADVERAEAEIVLALGLGRLVEDQLVGAARDRLALPVAILGAVLELPPVEPVAVLLRDRGRPP